MTSPPPRPALPTLARSAVDRLVERRDDREWLAAAWADPRTRAVVVGDGRVCVTDDPPRLDAVPTVEAPVGERYLLGADADAVAWFAVRVDDPGSSAVSLREVGARLDDRDAGLAVHAVALANWHASHTHCPRCGAATELVAAGAQRRCPVDESMHFPRTDPAMIVIVTDAEDRALLGRQAAWPPGRFSTLAGFVEPGESAERAVVREVGEEAGILVDSVEYLGSQPWPFPASLMLGFRARAAASTDPVVDGVELSEARWFTREALAAEVLAGVVTLPPEVSIARRLIEHWFGGRVAVDHDVR
ncbi:MAG: NAD(+) diphosphatase [Actinomycetes bacterium]